MYNAAETTSKTHLAADRDFAKCIWMLAGVVDYRLCDRSFDCEHCPFDIALHDRAQSASSAHEAGESGFTEVPGCALAGSFFYHPAHVWASVEEAGSVRTGLDDFAQKMMGRVYGVELPEEGERVVSGEACWRVAHKNGETNMTSPVSGVVRQVNAKLLQSPSLLNRSPYGEGWAFLLEPDSLKDSLMNLMYGQKARAWYKREIEIFCRRAGLIRGGVFDSTLPKPVEGARIKDIMSLMTVRQARRLIDSFLTYDGLVLSNEIEGR